MTSPSLTRSHRGILKERVSFSDGMPPAAGSYLSQSQVVVDGRGKLRDINSALHQSHPAKPVQHQGLELQGVPKSVSIPFQTIRVPASNPVHATASKSSSGLPGDVRKHRRRRRSKSRGRRKKSVGKRHGHKSTRTKVVHTHDVADQRTRSRYHADTDRSRSRSRPHVDTHLPFHTADRAMIRSLRGGISTGSRSPSRHSKGRSPSRRQVNRSVSSHHSRVSVASRSSRGSEAALLRELYASSGGERSDLDDSWSDPEMVVTHTGRLQASGPLIAHSFERLPSYASFSAEGLSYPRSMDENVVPVPKTGVGRPIGRQLQQDVVLPGSRGLRSLQSVAASEPHWKEFKPKDTSAGKKQAKPWL
jgi:hypothetical protein